MLTPRSQTPALNLPLVGGGAFDLAAEPGERFTLLTFYRGLHCPICVPYLRELDRLTADFNARGVTTVAISADDAERAAGMKSKTGAKTLRFAHSLPLSQARDWGLSMSTGRGKTSTGLEEPALFAEPGLFLVRADGTLYFASVQTMPFARPHFKDILGALDFVIKTDYPARGAYTGPV